MEHTPSGDSPHGLLWRVPLVWRGGSSGSARVEVEPAHRERHARVADSLGVPNETTGAFFCCRDVWLPLLSQETTVRLAQRSIPCAAVRPSPLQHHHPSTVVQPPLPRLPARPALLCTTPGDLNCGGDGNFLSRGPLTVKPLLLAT